MNNPDLNNQKVKFNQSVNVKYASNPTISTSLNSSIDSFRESSINKSSSKLINQTKPKLTNQLSINKLSTNTTTNQSSIKPLKSSSLINQLKLFKSNQPKRTSELNKISNQVQKMRTTLSTAVSEKNSEFRTKYGLNKTSNQTTSLLNKPAKTKPGTVVDEKIIVTHKNTLDSGPVLASTTVNKTKDQYKLPYGKGENIETNEFGEQIWKHKNLRNYEEKTKRKIRQEFDVPASAVVKKLNESTKLDKNNNNNEQINKSSSAQKKYMYGMNGGSSLSVGGLENNSQAVALHSTKENYSNTSNNNLNYSPFKDNKLNINGVFMVDKSIQCDLKKSKLNKERFSETGWKHYVEEPEEPKFREFSTDKWYYDKYEFEPGEIVPDKSRQVEGIGAYHQVNKWTKQINPSSLEKKTETQKKVNTEYKHNFSGSFKVIKADKDGFVTAYSNVKPPTSKNLGMNSAGQHVVSCNKAGEVIYSQVDKSKKRLLRDQMHTPLPGYDFDELEDEDELNLKKKEQNERPRSALKGSATDKYRLSSRSPSPVSRSKIICLNIPSEKEKSKMQKERSPSPQLTSDHHLLHHPAHIYRSSSTGPRIIRNRVYQVGYRDSSEPIEPPPQFATLNHHKLPPKAPASMSLQRTLSNGQQVRRVPIEADSRWYYQTEQSNLSDQSSVFGLKKNHETLEETMSFASSGSEFGIEKEQKRLNNRLADSTIRELDKKKKQISYDNQVTRHHSISEMPVANSIWYKSIDEDYRKGMAANDIMLPSLNYSSTTMSKLDKKKKSSKIDDLKTDRQAFTLDKRYLEERKKGNLLADKQLTKSSLLSRRPTQQASDFAENKITRNRQFNSTRDLTQTNITNQLDKQKRSSSLTRYNESESDASIASNNIKRSSNSRNALRGLNYPLKPVTRSASMHTSSMLNHPSLLRKQPSNIIRSTESDHGYNVRPGSRASATSRFSASGQNIIQNEPVVLYLPAIDNSAKENTLINTGSKATSKSNTSKSIGNKKLASSVNNLNSVSRTNSILSKLKTPANGSKKDVSKSTDKLNEITTKLNNYQNSKTLANKMTSKKELKRSQSIPKNAKLPLLTKLKNKLKSKD